MQTTLDLLDLAKKRTGLSDRALSQTLALSHASITMARSRRKLSPLLAGQLAALVGEDVEHWIALAAIEAAPRSRVTDHLRRLIDRAKKSWVAIRSLGRRSTDRAPN